MTSKICDTNFDEGIWHNNKWIESWSSGDTGFHMTFTDPFLDKNEADIFGGKTKSIFAPLCGKSLDMLWMYNKGHSVCGVDIAEQAVQEFFDENNIEKNIDKVDNIGVLYKSKDERIKLYVADLFDMLPSVCGQFDVIWDSKSLVAINVADHNLYRDVLLGLMKPDSLYYLNTLDYDSKVWPGPPHSLPDEKVMELYGDRCTVNLMEEADATQMFKKLPRDEDGTISDPTFRALSTSPYLYTRWYRIKLK
ncbi:hypothetical protein ACF0H5_010113 [Mactra antiquata]